MFRLGPASLLAAALVGCNATLSAYDVSDAPADAAPSDEGTDAGGDTATPSDDTSNSGPSDTGGPTLPPGATEVMLDTLEPNYGTMAGGTTVTLTGGPFDNLVEVTFGGAPATVLSSTSTEVTLQTPSTATEGWADVHAVIADGNSVTPVQFQYWPDGTGLTGALGAIEWYVYVGGYWADPQPQPYGFAQTFFVEPTSDGFGSAFFAPSVDNCTLAYAGAPITVELPGVPQLDLGTPTGSTVRLYQDTTVNFDWFYYNSPFPPDGHSPPFITAGVLGGSFDLDPTVGNVDWPEMTVSGFTGTVPAAPLMVTNPQLAQTNPPTIGPSFTLQWAASSADYVVARLIRQRFDGTLWVNQEDVTCWLANDGQHTVPNLWSQWDPQSDGVYFIVGHYNEPSSTLPHNGAASQVAGAHWTVGFAVAQ